MLISTEIGSAGKIIGEEKAVEYIAKAGFDAWDFSMFNMRKYNSEKKCFLDAHPLSKPNYLKFARELKKIGEENGIVCNQSHAPFPSNLVGIDYLKRAIECTAEANGEICVIHPCNTADAKQNSEMYFELLPFARQYGVKIATENMWCWDAEKGHSTFAACATSESFLEHLHTVNDPDFVACLDLGHAEMRGSGSGASNMIEALGKKYLKALHIHDNDLLHDSHQIPFSMSMDYISIITALKKIGYSGYFTLEAGQYLNSFDESNIFDGIKNLQISAKRLADMFENN